MRPNATRRSSGKEGQRAVGVNISARFGVSCFLWRAAFCPIDKSSRPSSPCCRASRPSPLVPCRASPSASRRRRRAARRPRPRATTAYSTSSTLTRAASSRPLASSWRDAIHSRPAYPPAVARARMASHAAHDGTASRVPALPAIRRRSRAEATLRTGAPGCSAL